MSDMLHEFSKRSGIPDDEVLENILLQQRSTRKIKEMRMILKFVTMGKAKTEQEKELINDGPSIQI